MFKGTEHDLEYDYLVIATGARNNTFGVPGVNPVGSTVIGRLFGKTNEGDFMESRILKPGTVFVLKKGLSVLGIRDVFRVNEEDAAHQEDTWRSTD